MEGKEVRFGIPASSLFAVITTAASCGAVNAMHDSFTALGGMVPLINIQLGEIIVGGVGAGMYGMLLFIIITIFVAGLMVGRTPEYVGKKIEAKEVKMAMLAILILPLMYLGWTAVAVVIPSAVAATANPGPHGFTEVLYAYVSQTGNNGSAPTVGTPRNPRRHAMLVAGSGYSSVTRLPALLVAEIDPTPAGTLHHRRPFRWAGRRHHNHRRAHLFPAPRSGRLSRLRHQ
jgi:hypothetical protein